MKLFKVKADTASATKTVKNKFALKYGGFSIGIIAIVLAAVIILNILMGVLDERGLLKLDITPSGKFTISADNEAFIKNIDRPVKVTVLSTKAEYASYLSDFSANYKNVLDQDGYFEQTVKLLDRYAELNKNITIEYISYYGAQTKEIAQDHPNIFYGDIIVSAIGKSGQETERVISFDNIYTYADDSGMASMGYGSYYLNGNNIETSLTSAINVLLYGEIKNMGFVKSHSTAELFEYTYKKTLELNGFEITTLDAPVITEIDPELDALAIIAPSSDLLAEEITAISKWLDNGGKKGKSLIFVPNVTVANFPNLSEFLEEWGIKYSAGELYQTNSEYHYPNDPSTTLAQASTGDITEKIIENTSLYCLLGQNVPMEKAYEAFESRTTYTVISTNDTVTVKPTAAAENWKPDGDALLKSYPNLIVTAENAVIDEKQYTSYVAAFSSYEFIYSAWVDANTLNLDAALGTALYTSGMDSDSTITFVPKTIEQDSFADKVTQASSNAVFVIFIVLIPIAIVAAGIIVFIRRRKRCA